MSILIKNGIIVTQDEQRRILKADVLIEGNRIIDIGKHRIGDAEQIIDAKGKIVLPGLINLHTHVAMATMRGIADDVSFDDFLKRTFSADAKRTEQDVLDGARLGCAEMALTGTTTFLDLYYAQDKIAQAVEEVGIRGFLGWAVLDDDKTTQKGSPIKNCARFIKKIKRKKLVKPVVAPQGVYVCSEETMCKARELADRNRTFCTYHLSETRGEVYSHLEKTDKRPVDWLKDIGFLSEGDVAVHVGWITKGEARALVDSGVSIAHCPTSNLKLAVGSVAPIIEIQEVGGTVGLGTDGCSSNNSLDMFIEMKICALIHKHCRWDPTVMSAQKVLDMATIDGAKALGVGDKLGSIKPGKLADIIIVDSTRIGMRPLTKENVVSNLVYSCSGQFVYCTIVNGKIVAYDGALVTRLT